MLDQTQRLAPADLAGRYRRRETTLGVVGLGYVGLPLACASAEAGFRVVGFDVDRRRAAQVDQGVSHLEAIDPEAIQRHVADGLLSATADFDRLGEVDAVIICVPTPITAQREPDLSYVIAATEAVAATLRRGQLIVLESTTWPGTTVEVMRPILERDGLKSGKDFYLAFSPEREDPGNAHHSTSTIPKVVGGDGPDAQRIAVALYESVIASVVPVSSTQTAEAVKLTENIFRAVNIALVNELKVVFQAMDIDIWEVIEAAKSKPFGFMPFYPGPGLGGHCIPIDPFYLTWKAREFDLSTHFIELAGQINSAMPRHVVQRLAEAVDRQLGKGLKGTRILLVGMAYKKNVADCRESPALKLLELLEDRGALVAYHDPHVAAIKAEHGTNHSAQASLDWSPEMLQGFDAAIIVTDHDTLDYAELIRHSSLVLDTRNACGSRHLHAEHIHTA